MNGLGIFYIGAQALAFGAAALVALDLPHNLFQHYYLHWDISTTIARFSIAFGAAFKGDSTISTFLASLGV